MENLKLFGTSANLIVKTIRTFGDNQEDLCDVIQLYDTAEHKLPNDIAVKTYCNRLAKNRKIQTSYLIAFSNIESYSDEYQKTIKSFLNNKGKIVVFNNDNKKSISIYYRDKQNIIVSKNICASKIVEYLKATNEINLINENINTDSLYKFLHSYLG
ncbi:hypothetical protein [Fusobacterium polymorphum]|uniref:hypothetical protein n=1 Tax=Fusobacterium nucleatum subsp. polymorphum TaxID=76857 RepID=UPI003009BF9C